MALDNGVWHTQLVKFKRSHMDTGFVKIAANLGVFAKFLFVKIVNRSYSDVLLNL